MKRPCYTMTYLPSADAVSQERVINTHHDMVRAGISLSSDRAIEVCGGKNTKASSNWLPEIQDWAANAEINLLRGHNSGATLSDGTIFTIGGMWSGARGGPNGERYHPERDTRDLLSVCDVIPMLTNDKEGV